VADDGGLRKTRSRSREDTSGGGEEDQAGSSLARTMRGVGSTLPDPDIAVLFRLYSSEHYPLSTPE